MTTTPTTTPTPELSGEETLEAAKRILCEARAQAHGDSAITAEILIQALILNDVIDDLRPGVSIESAAIEIGTSLRTTYTHGVLNLHRHREAIRAALLPRIEKYVTIRLALKAMLHPANASDTSQKDPH